MEVLFGASVIPDYRGKTAGKDFEKDTMSRLEKEKELGNGSFGRYGTKASFFKKPGEDGVQAHAQQSLPDFEGDLWNGQHCIWDNKVVSGASFDMSKYRAGTRGAKALQLEHMMDRSRFRAICGFLIHFNSRKLSKSVEPSKTFWLTVHPQMRLWKAFDRGDITNINRSHCEEFGVKIRWTKRERDRKYRPDVVGFLLERAGLERVGR